MARRYTTQLLEMMDEGIILPKRVAEACLNYMSEAEVEDMATCEGLIDAEEESDDEET